MFLWWGKELTQFYNDGYRPSIGSDKHPKALGQPGRQCWPEIWHIIGPQIEGVMSRGESTWHEDALVPIFRDGKLEDVYWTYSYSPVRDAQGVIRGTLVTCSDTTGRVMAEDALRTEQGRLLNMFQQAPGFLAVLRGPDHVFELHNPPYSELIGQRNVVGKSVLQALPEAASQGFIDILDCVYQSGEPFVAHSYPIDLQRSSGQPLERRYIDFTYQAMREADGTISGIIALGVDVTERKRAEDALRNTEKLAAVGRLAASIAHEINNPLEAITNLLFLMAYEPLVDPAKKYLDLAQRELARVTAIATQTLRFHRQATNASETSLRDVIESALTLFHGRITNAGVSIERQYKTDKKIRAFEGDLRQVFANLLSNALDATSPGGKIIIRLRESQDVPEGKDLPEINDLPEVNDLPEANNLKTARRYVRLTIADTGIGMTPETRQHMFEPFFTTKNVTGTGLGLWVSAEILANHRAITRVRSSQNPDCHGTVISISFPLEPRS
jgi:signal transduction histidine kinase